MEHFNFDQLIELTTKLKFQVDNLVLEKNNINKKLDTLIDFLSATPTCHESHTGTHTGTHNTSPTLPQTQKNNIGNSWNGGFGGMNSFNPLTTPLVVQDDTDYSIRPVKNVEGEDNVLYMYENETGVCIDKEDLSLLLDKFENSNDMEDFTNKLKQISTGIREMHLSRDPDLYIQQLNIMDIPITVKYNKVSNSTHSLTSFSKVFDTTSLETRYM